MLNISIVSNKRRQFVDEEESVLLGRLVPLNLVRPVHRTPCIWNVKHSACTAKINDLLIFIWYFFIHTWPGSLFQLAGCYKFQISIW